MTHITAEDFERGTQKVLQAINDVQDLCATGEFDGMPPLTSRSSIEAMDWALNIQHYLTFIRDFSDSWITEDDIPHIERVILLSDPDGKIFLECINESIY